MRLSDFTNEKAKQAFRERRKFEAVRTSEPMCEEAKGWLKVKWGECVERSFFKPAVTPPLTKTSTTCLSRAARARLNGE